MKTTTNPSFIVGIVGSAGALGAYRALLEALPANLGMAYVVISHMSTTAHSQLAKILSRYTKMPTIVASPGLPIQRDHVYVISPDVDLFVEGHAFKVVSPRASRNNQGDLFLISMAETMGARAIGIIFSGYSSDGAQGCRHIKAMGGTTFAQDSSAEVDSMPLSAQASGAVDFVLPPGKMPGTLKRLVKAAKSKRFASGFKTAGARASPLATTLPQQNHLLAALPADVRNRLFPHLELMPMLLGDVLYEPGDTMRYAYFPTSSIVALFSEMTNGASTEIAMVGNDGFVGVSLITGGEHTSSRAVVQNAGFAYRLLGQWIKNEFVLHGETTLLLLRYTQALMTQMTQTAACSQHHSIDQRLCRWLLLSLDRLPTHHLNMTQELISKVLGVRREGVTEAASRLQDADVIEYNRGKIMVLDRAKLEGLSCECYAVVKKETDRLLHYLGNVRPRTA